MTELVKKLTREKITMVPEACFEPIFLYKEHINSLQGEIVECGVWRGGFSIFLASEFPDKKIWVCDSFEGFQPLENAKYQFAGERHAPDYTLTGFGPIGVSLEDVKANFASFGLVDDRIQYLKGFVKNTLTPDCGIGDIAVLRVDVDAYSATMEVLEALYHKVVPGGLVIFDDSCLMETKAAMNDFFASNNIPPIIYSPSGGVLNLNQRYTNDDSGLPQSCYIIKQ